MQTATRVSGWRQQRLVIGIRPLGSSCGSRVFWSSQVAETLLQAAEQQRPLADIHDSKAIYSIAAWNYRGWVICHTRTNDRNVVSISSCHKQLPRDRCRS